MINSLASLQFRLPLRLTIPPLPLVSPPSLLPRPSHSSLLLPPILPHPQLLLCHLSHPACPSRLSLRERETRWRNRLLLVLRSQGEYSIRRQGKGVGMLKLRELSGAREEGRRKMRLGRRRERNEVAQRGGRGKVGSEGESWEELRR